MLSVDIRKQKTDKILLLNNDICREMIGSYDDKDNNGEGALPRVSFFQPRTVSSIKSLLPVWMRILVMMTDRSLQER